jgi:allophanate hydrolase
LSRDYSNRFLSFLEAGQMLFDGPWVAERYSSLFSFLSKYPNDVLDTTLAIINNGQKWSGKDVFEAQKRVNEIKVILEKEIGVNEFLLTPTVGFLCKISE